MLSATPHLYLVAGADPYSKSQSRVSEVLNLELRLCSLPERLARVGLDHLKLASTYFCPPSRGLRRAVRPLTSAPDGRGCAEAARTVRSRVL